MYFPEGTWNLTPNLPMLPCYWGIVDIAKQGGAVVIPVAAEQYGKHFKINIGENFDMNAYGEGIAEKARAIADLRDVLATLKYEIWELSRQSGRHLQQMNGTHILRSVSASGPISIWNILRG